MDNQLPQPPEFSPEYRAYLSECGRKGMAKRWPKIESITDPVAREQEIAKRQEMSRELNRRKREKQLDKLRQPGAAIAM